MNTLIWQDPPKATKGRNSILITAEILELLQSYPGKWLSVGNYHRSTWARTIRAHFAGEIEMTSRNNSQQRADLYLRWVKKV